MPAKAVRNPVVSYRGKASGAGPGTGSFIPGRTTALRTAAEYDRPQDRATDLGTAGNVMRDIRTMRAELDPNNYRLLKFEEAGERNGTGRSIPVWMHLRSGTKQGT